MRCNSSTVVVLRINKIRSNISKRFKLKLKVIYLKSVFQGILFSFLIAIIVRKIRLLMNLAN